jgi:hypothetical protein
MLHSPRHGNYYFFICSIVFNQLISKETNYDVVFDILKGVQNHCYTNPITDAHE